METEDKIINRVLYGVDVVVFNDKEEVLMLNRSVKDEKYKTGWEFIKGGLKQNENYLQAGLREIKEEAGITTEYVGELDKEFIVDARYRNKPHYNYVHKKALIFSYREGQVIIDKKEHDDYKWMDIGEALDSVWVEYGREILSKAHRIYLESIT